MPVVGTLVVLAACSGGGEEVAATGDPAAATDTTTTTEPAPTTTTTEPAPTTAPAPTATASEDDCPPQDGEHIRYVVDFHEWPDNLEEGQNYACGRILDVNPPPGPTFIVTAVWDEDDFLTRTGEDPNVRYAEPDQPAHGAGDATGSEPFGSEEPTA